MLIPKRFLIHTKLTTVLFPFSCSFKVNNITGSDGSQKKKKKAETNEQEVKRRKLNTDNRKSMNKHLEHMMMTGLDW